MFVCFRGRHKKAHRGMDSGEREVPRGEEINDNLSFSSHTYVCVCVAMTVGVSVYLCSSMSVDNP